MSIILLFLAAYSRVAFAAAKAEDIVAQHLASIGTAEARAAVKSRGVEGTLRFKVLVGGAGETPGTWQRMSEPGKSRFVMKFGDSKWWGEQFVFDGSKVSYAAANSSHQWSSFGGFVASQDALIREGMLGGELGTDWALENLDRKRVKLDYVGRKKVDGRELECIEYLSKTNGDMTVKFYFEPDTHHHLLSIYSVSRGASIAHSDTATARQKEIRYSIEERFGDFETDAGITLPRQYDLGFSQELQNGRVDVYEWIMTADKVFENPTIDPANFQIK